MSSDLLFRHAPTGPDLVFGDDDGIVQGAATATLDADFDPLALSVVAAEPLSASMDADFGELPAHVAASYDNNVSRPVVAKAAALWQAAHGVQTARSNAWAIMAHAASSVRSGWQDGCPVQSSVRCGWTALTRTRSSAASRWQDGSHVRTGAASRWQDTIRTRASARSRWQDATRARSGLLSRWQDMDHSRRLRRESRWLDADPQHTGRQSRTGTAVHLPLDLLMRWQDAIVPPPGISPRPNEPGVTPHQEDADLVFCHYPTGSDLVFGAPRDYNPQEPEQPGHVIPVRRIYMGFNEATLRRTDSSATVEALSIDIGIDRDSWTWNWSAEIAYSEWAALSAMNGEPLELEAMINGYRWLLTAEGAPRRRREFGTTTVSIQGRGIACELDEPAADVQNFYGDQLLSAQQIMAKALTYNGVSLGWNLDWKITDWIVPAGIWSVTGAPIAGVLNVAEAVKAVVQADRERRILHILPRYKAPPWKWSTLTPDIQIPPDVIITDEIEPIQKPAYNAIYVAGQVSGNLSRVYRSGSAADKLAQMVSHPLLTESSANRQRGVAELSETGRMALIGITMPLSDDTSLLSVGQLASMTEDDEPWRGLITGTNVSARYSEDQGLVVSQSANIERHYA